MTVAVVALALLCAGLAACLVVSNRQLQQSNADLLRAVMAKNGVEYALIERNVKKPAVDVPEETPRAPLPVDRDELEEFVARSISQVEGNTHVPQPVGLDGT